PVIPLLTPILSLHTYSLPLPYTPLFRSIAVLAAFATADYKTAGVVAFFMLMGEIIETRTAEGARASIESLIKLTPTKARRILKRSEEHTSELQSLRHLVCRLLLVKKKDITVEKPSAHKQLLVHIRWQGGACSDLHLQLPPKITDRVRYPATVVDRIRDLAQRFSVG